MFVVFNCPTACTPMECLVAGQSALLWGVSCRIVGTTMGCFIAGHYALPWGVSLPDGLHFYGVFHCRIACTPLECFIAG